MNLHAWIIRVLLFVTLLLPACSSHHSSQNADNATYFVLTGQEAERLVQYCSRFKDGVEGYWTPEIPDLQKLEANLNKHLNSFGPELESKLLRYTRQYAGAIKGGRRLIFVNGFLKTLGDKMGSDISKEALILYGGGSAVYRVEYDVESKAIQNFAFNPER